jgi:hypothetical protein
MNASPKRKDNEQNKIGSSKFMSLGYSIPFELIILKG